MLESLILNDTVAHAGDYVARFRRLRPDGRAYLFATWLNIGDPADPARWIAYERAAAPAWDCVALHIDRRTRARTPAERLIVIPAADALAELAAQASAGKVAGVSLPTLFADEVHLTPAGNYYVAMIAHGVIAGEMPGDAWLPEEIDRATGKSLRAVAAGYLAEYRARPRTVDAGGCRDYLAGRFIPGQLGYLRDHRWAGEGRLRAYARWARYRAAWPRLLRSDGAGNPLASSHT